MSFDDKNRVKKRRDFTRVYRQGKSLSAVHTVVCWRKTKNDCFRVGFTVSKKVGNAVVRNKVRRRLKEIARLHPERFLIGTDYIIVARPAAASCEYRELDSELERLLRKIKP